MRLTTAFVLALLLAGGAGAQQESPWTLVVKREAVRLLTVDSSMAGFWAVGEKGAVFASADGKLWRKIKPFTDRNLYGVSFGDAQNGCIVGEGGFVATTDDAGENWTAQKPGITEDLRAVSFANRTVGCAVGIKGTLLMSYDQGKNWSKKDAGFGESFFSANMPNTSEAWVVGERGMILHSVDSGRTWLSERHSTKQWLYSVWFRNDIGWIAGRNGTILRYMMKKWEPIPLPTTSPTALYAVSGESGESVCVTGGGGACWMTTDSGMSWQARENISREDLTSIAFSGKVGWIVGAENSMFSTIDGGVSWATYNLESLPQYKDISFIDPSWGWVVGRNGYIWNTRDGGETWGMQSSGARNLNSVVAISRAMCFAAGEDSIIKTDDGGLSWRHVHRDLSPEEQAKPKKDRREAVVFYGIDFFDQRRGWAVGTQGAVVYTSNEGEYWERIKTGINHALYAVWFLSPSDGMAVGEEGMLYTTGNGGRKWDSKPVSSSGEALRSIFFLDNYYGWIVGDGGTILSTSDGGRNWRELRLGGYSLQKVWFTDRAQGWIAGERGVLVRTWDGGNTWMDDHPPVATDFTGLFFFGADSGWAVGDRGVILAYRPNRGGTTP